MQKNKISIQAEGRGNQACILKSLLLQEAPWAELICIYLHAGLGSGGVWGGVLAAAPQRAQPLCDLLPGSSDSFIRNVNRLSQALRPS